MHACCGGNMKRISVLLLILILAVSFAFASLDAKAYAEPSAICFTWNAVEGASFYDIYNGQDFIVRLPEGTYSYRLGNLPSNTEYSFSIAARDEANNTLDASFMTVTTDSWDGIYEWINQTDDDNNGKMKSVKLRIETATDPSFGQYHLIYMIMDDGTEAKIFPLYDFDDPASGEWVDYKDDSTVGTSYRLNADRLNTSIFKPSKWRLDSVSIGYDSGKAYIQSRALGLAVDSVSSYRFFMEDGEKKMAFLTSGAGMAESILFKNPNPGEGDELIMNRISD